MDLWLWLWSLRRSSSGEDSSHLSFPGHVQPTGNSNIRDINHHAFAKHLTCFVLNEVSKITTQHVDDSPCLWKRPLSGLQKHNTKLGHYILVCKPEKVTKPHNMWLIFFKMVRKKKDLFTSWVILLNLTRLSTGISPVQFLSLRLQAR